MKFQTITPANIEQLQSFLDSLTEELTTFRYFVHRDLTAIKNHVHTCLLYSDAGEAIGYGHIDYEDDVYWLGLVIKKKFQGKGYGSTMLEHLLDECGNSQITKIRLTCDVENTAALHLYQNYNFVQTASDINKVEMLRVLEE